MLANYTDEASLKHTYTLITVDRDEIDGDGVYARRVREYSSSFLDLKDCTQHKNTWGTGCSPRDRPSQ